MKLQALFRLLTFHSPNNGRLLYVIPLTSEEYYKFNKLYLAPGFFEYKGKYYQYNPPALQWCRGSCICFRAIR